MKKNRAIVAISLGQEREFVYEDGLSVWSNNGIGQRNLVTTTNSTFAPGVQVQKVPCVHTTIHDIRKKLKTFSVSA